MDRACTFPRTKLRALQGSKAAPPHLAPHVLWKAAAKPVADFVAEVQGAKWATQGTFLPVEWAASWLVFQSKPNKAGNKPEHMRPISLLEPLGKAMSGLIKERLFEHCSQVREKAKAQGRSLYELRAGIPRRGCVCGLQVSADFSQAFDRIGRHLLEEALAFLGVPADLSYVIMSWVHATAFHVLQDGYTESYDSVRGIRQGCKLSPTLWCCISVLLTHKLDEQLGTNWCQQHGVFFADDTRMRWNIESLQELGQACAQASKALGILESNGLVLSRERQSVYCALTAHKRQLRCGRSCTRLKTKLQWSGEYLLPLQTTHVYLGAVVSYFDFEFQSAKHRAHAGHVTFQRLRKFLMAKRTVSFKRRLALWKSTVIPSMLYAVTASGLDRRGYDLIRIQMTKQVRAIANSPRHLTLESDSDFWRRIAAPSATYAGRG